LDFNAGELYAISDNQILYFGRIEGSIGGNDLWITTWIETEWSEPVNLGSAINTPGNESLPYISSDETELWYTGYSESGYIGPSIFRSIKIDNQWSEGEEIISNYVGDPGMDAAGNLYFTHLFYDPDVNKIEADIYVAYKR